MGVMKRLSEQIASSSRRRRTVLGSADGLPFEISLKSISEIERYNRSKDLERVKQFNDDVKGWAIDVTKKLRVNVRMLVSEDKRLSSSIEPNIYTYKKKKDGEAERIGFSFAREGVYIHKGAGRGQGGFRGGSKWTDRYGTLKRTDPASYYKMGTGNRREIRWFDPVISANLPALANIVAEYAATMQLDASRIFIDR